MNPSLNFDASTFSIQVFKGWDPENQPVKILAENRQFFIPESEFELSSGDANLLLSKPLAGFVSNYSIDFTPQIEISSNQGCFVKYTFPPELDAQHLILEGIEAKGMFVNENGEIAVIDQEQIIQSLSQNSSPQWIAIPGCHFDIIGKTGEQLENFVQNSFELTFQNITNPIQSEDSSEFLIQIFQSWNEQAQEFETLIAESSDFKIKKELLSLSGGVITECSISISNQTLGVTSDNIATISFTPYSEMLQEGIIVLETPIWSKSRYDQESMQFLDEYFFGGGEQECTSESFEVFQYTVFQRFMKVTYQGVLSPDDPIQIHCSNWKNPNLPSVTQGFSIMTFDSNQQFAQDFTAGNLVIDSRNYETDEIQNEQISYYLTHQHANELSDYKIKFDTDILIDAQDECYVKFTFPPELGTNSIELDDIHGSGMFVDSTGAEQIFQISQVISNIGDDSDQLKWITVPGCQVDLAGKTEQQLQKFEQNHFEIVFHNLMNPPIKEDTSQFMIEIFKSWDSTNMVGIDKLAQASSFFFPERFYGIQGGIITDVSMTTSSEYLGNFEENTVTITFTPATSLPIQKGAIEIVTPDWGQIYDHNLEQSIISFPNTDVSSCSSEHFTIVDLHESADNIIHIDFIDLVGANTDAVSITCNNWKNPILRGHQPGYVLKTFDSGEYLIDEAENFSFDGSNLKKAPIAMNQIEFTSYVSLSGSLDGFTLNFKSGVNIESKNGCFIKFTFPISFDFTGKSFESVTTSGMLVDSDGNEQNLTQDKVQSNLWNSSRTSTWFAIEGCQFDSANIPSVNQFQQDVFKMEILGFQGFKLTQPVEPVRIQIYKGWDTVNNEGSMILSDSGSISIPAEALTRTTFDSYPLQFVEVLVSEIRLEGDLDEFQSSNGEETFIQDISDGLEIEQSQILVTSVTAGSVVIEYEIQADPQLETTASDLQERQDEGLLSGEIDLGAEVLGYSSEIQTRTVSSSATLTGPETGQGVQIGPLEDRELDPYNINDNCMFCLAQNENILEQGEAGFVFTVFCQLPDFSDSECCHAQYDFEGNLNFEGYSRFDQVCIVGESAGLCSIQKVQNKPNSQNYFQMYEQCLAITERSTADVNDDFTQFKGQGQADSICGESPKISFQSSQQQYAYFELGGQVQTDENNSEEDSLTGDSSSQFSSQDDLLINPESLCQIDIEQGLGESASDYVLELTSNGDQTNNNRFYLVDMGNGHSDEISLQELSYDESIGLSVPDASQYKLLTIFDSSNEHIQTKIRYGLKVERVKCMMRFEYEGGFYKYQNDGGHQKFKMDIAATLGIGTNYFDVISIYEGSVKVEYYIQTDESSSLSIEELYLLHKNSFEVGTYEAGIGGTILEFDPGDIAIESSTLPDTSDQSDPEVILQEKGGSTIQIIIIGICAFIIIIVTVHYVNQKKKQSKQDFKVAQMNEQSLAIQKLEDQEMKRIIIEQEDITFKPVKNISESQEFLKLNESNSKLNLYPSSQDVTNINQIIAEQDLPHSDINGRNQSGLQMNTQTGQDFYNEQLNTEQRKAEKEARDNRRQQIEGQFGKIGFKVEVEGMIPFNADRSRRKQFSFKQQMEIIEKKKQLRMVNNYLE